VTEKNTYGIRTRRKDNIYINEIKMNKQSKKNHEQTALFCARSLA